MPGLVDLDAVESILAARNRHVEKAMPFERRPSAPTS
jgi:hypothetical protein